MGIRLSDEELEALELCSLGAYRLYVQCLRPTMDFQTGIVGRGYAISRGMLAINVQYVPPRGSKRRAWKPTLLQIDAMIEELIRVGLVKRASAPQETMKLVLRLPMAVLSCPVDEHDLNTKDEHDTDAAPERQQTKGFDAHCSGDEHDLNRHHEHDISDVSCVVFNTRARGNEPSAEVMPSRNSGPVESATYQTALAAFRGALGRDYRDDVQTLKAVAQLKRLCSVTDVDPDEVRLAVAMAREKSPVYLSSYAIRIIEAGVAA
ncbi:hypothetical protein GKE73_16805 [Paludibacterium sp. dN 18-1]|uniref:Replication protein n=2 Tax=Paludibacterium denitrificans TaxID=2675226 RepID=A0A844GFI5_9NEIS|nr:hypothetical protein [Paludibacterium denitrificans]